jgi:hypothetical protein
VQPGVGDVAGDARDVEQEHLAHQHPVAVVGVGEAPPVLVDGQHLVAVPDVRAATLSMPLSGPSDGSSDRSGFL